jgi:hypothetical protein
LSTKGIIRVRAHFIENNEEIKVEKGLMRGTANSVLHDLAKNGYLGNPLSRPVAGLVANA